MTEYYMDEKTGRWEKTGSFKRSRELMDFQHEDDKRQNGKRLDRNYWTGKSLGGKKADRETMEKELSRQYNGYDLDYLEDSY